MKIIDFDAHFFEYAKKWLAAHPGLNEDQIDDSYNDMMAEWIRLPADWLDGATPEDYFDRYETADELLDLLQSYSDAGVNLPEPLYARIVDAGEKCEGGLREIVEDGRNAESLRAEAMGLLRDMNSRCADDVLEGFVIDAEERNELSELAADILRERDEDTVRRLLDGYRDAPSYAQGLILDIACAKPGDPRTIGFLLERLEDYPDEYALTASLLNKLGDERAIEPLQRILDMQELSYFDYIELRAAVEALGGDPGEERCFDGDRDYEVLKNL